MQHSAAPAWLGIDGGGTKSVAAYECGAIRRRVEAGPGNLRLLSDAQLLALFKTLSTAHAGMPDPAGIAIGMAAARLEVDRTRIREFAAKVWPNTPCYACHDLETALAAAELDARQDNAVDSYTAILIALSGTGSCFFGKNARGEQVKIGGWGHVVGDKGSAYEIGLRGIKAVLHYHDQDGKLPRLGEAILRQVMLNELPELSAWAMDAPKRDIAALAVEVFKAARSGDRIARDILAGAANSIAHDAVTCARRLARPRQRVRIVFAGSVLLKQPQFAQRVTALIHKLRPNAVVVALQNESARGAVELAKLHAGPAPAAPSAKLQRRARPGKVSDADRIRRWVSELVLTTSPTEQRNPLSMGLDKLPLGEAIALMLREDEKIPAAILAERKSIEGVVRAMVRAFKAGGRLFYVGAGTSGRLGVLDASECPPTFRADPEMVQGIIAGGHTALWRAAEGAEDDPEAGAHAIQSRNVRSRDVVVGIAASGRTPFVWGALQEGKRRGATTVLLTFNPGLKIPRELRPAIVIAPNIGPEILTGSTRLKSGTATKLTLNIFTTVTMVRLGKVLSNLMVDVKPTNVKLRDRAVRIVQTLTGVDEPTAKAALERHQWVVKTAAERLMREAGGKQGRRRAV